MILQAITNYLNTHLKRFRARCTDSPDATHINIYPKYNNIHILTIYLQESTITWRSAHHIRTYDLNDPKSLPQITTQLNKDILDHVTYATPSNAP